MAKLKRCPENFEITLDMRQWAREKVPGVNIDEETEAFKDHEFARSKSDWIATWRNWMRETARRQSRYKPAQQSVSVVREQLQSGEMAQLIARRNATGFVGCRMPEAGETVIQYRAYQDKYWLEQRERKLRLVR